MFKYFIAVLYHYYNSLIPIAFPLADYLHSDFSFLRNMESLNAKRMDIYGELESIGFGLNKLRLLSNTIGEIAAENNISSTMAVQGFFKSLEKQYDIKLRSQFENNSISYA